MTKLNRINHFKILRFIFGKSPDFAYQKVGKSPADIIYSIDLQHNVKQAARRGSPASVMSCPEDYLFSIHFCSKILSCLLVL